MLEMVWLAKSKIFTVWPFTEKHCWLGLGESFRAAEMKPDKYRMRQLCCCSRGPSGGALQNNGDRSFCSLVSSCLSFVQICLMVDLIRPSGRGRAFPALTVTDQQVPALKPPQQLTNPVCCVSYSPIYHTLVTKQQTWECFIDLLLHEHCSAVKEMGI